MNIPIISSVETAVEIYRMPYIGNKQIMMLFDRGLSTAVKLKKVAAQYMAVHGVQSNSTHTVNTDAAFKAWGLDIKRLKRSCKGGEE